jgi:hypothetical protein
MGRKLKIQAPNQTPNFKFQNFQVMINQLQIIDDY